jgi:hypothetical protein
MGKASGSRPQPKKLYLVQRLGWNVWEDGGRPACSRDDSDCGVPVRAFNGRKQAEEFCREQERQARRELSPFQFHHDFTEEEEERLLAGLRELGLEPPTAQEFPYRDSENLIEWRAWWDAVAPGLSEAQREALWDLLEGVHLYEVVAIDWEGNASGVTRWKP